MTATNNYGGQPAMIETSRPGPVNIVSTSSSTPIVITTDAPHGLSTGDWFACGGSAEPHVNGVFLAGVCTATTVQAFDKVSGAAIAPTSGATGAAGTLTNLGFGVTVPLLNDDDMFSAALWNVPFSALLDRTAYLLYRSHYSTHRKVLRRKRVLLPDASQTVSVNDGDRFELPASPVAPRIITLESLSPSAPMEGECMEFVAPNPNASATFYTFKRRSGVTVASFAGSATRTAQTMAAEFEFANGVWRLGMSTGTAYDGTTDYGVIPGAGA